MALDTKQKAAGVKDILRRLRGESPLPLQPEDQIEQVMAGPEEDEEVFAGIAPTKRPGPPVPPRTPR